MGCYFVLFKWYESDLVFLEDKLGCKNFWKMFLKYEKYSCYIGIKICCFFYEIIRREKEGGEEVGREGRGSYV